jgi:hypothetical protein
MKLLCLFCSLILGFISYAQTEESDNSIALSVVMPETLEGLDYSQLSKIDTKVRSIISNYGVGASGYSNNFVIYPKFGIVDQSVVEGGMQNITVVTVEFSLFIKQVDNNLMFGSFNKTIKGSGTNKTTALTNAVQLIPVKDKELEKFITGSKQKIIDYYTKNCDRILSEATSLNSAGDLEKALGVLSNVPQEVPCYEKVKAKMVEVYKAYVNKQCKQQLNEANAHIAAQRYNQALTILASIDPSSTCNSDVKAAISKIESQVSEKEKRDYEEKMERYKNSVELEKERINAVRDIAVAYYNRTQPTYNYLMIIR